MGELLATWLVFSVGIGVLVLAVVLHLVDDDDRPW